MTFIICSLLLVVSIKEYMYIDLFINVISKQGHYIVGISPLSIQTMPLSLKYDFKHSIRTYVRILGNIDRTGKKGLEAS